MAPRRRTKKDASELKWGEELPINCLTCAQMYISPIFAEAIATTILQEKHSKADREFKRQLARNALEQFHKAGHK